jgi:hypothetical protein
LLYFEPQDYTDLHEKTVEDARCKTCGPYLSLFYLPRFENFAEIKFFFSPKYRGTVLEGEVAEAAEGIIRENCKELDIEVIDKPFFKKESFTKETGISTA